VSYVFDNCFSFPQWEILNTTRKNEKTFNYDINKNEMLNTPGKNVKYTNLSFYILFLKRKVAALYPDHIMW